MSGNKSTDGIALLMEKVRKAVLYWDRGDPMRDAIDDDDIGQALNLLVGLVPEPNVSGDAKPTFAGVENLTAGPRNGLSPEPRDSDALDAAKWRALRNCARITAMGAAGVDGTYMAGDDCHVTLNFWTHNDREQEVYPRQWLDQFVAKAMRLSTTKEGGL